jgi:hypothetical protein
MGAVGLVMARRFWGRLPVIFRFTRAYFARMKWLE